MKISEINVGDLVILKESGATCCSYHRFNMLAWHPDGMEYLCEVVQIGEISVTVLVPKGYGTPLTPAWCEASGVPSFKSAQHDYKIMRPEGIVRREEGSW